MTSEEILIRECKKFNKLAQKEVYDKYSPVLRAICIRYVKDNAQAKDVLQECFIKIFSKIKQFKGNGSFEGWLKRITVNTAITYCKKNKYYDQSIEIDQVKEIKSDADVDFEFEEEQSMSASELKNKEFDYDVALSADLSKEELLEAMNSIPENFRVVFSLFFIDNYRHKEIADELGIDENTSRTRLLRARKMIQQKLYQMCLDKVQQSVKN